MRRALLGWYAPGHRWWIETLFLLAVLTLTAEETVVHWTSTEDSYRFLRTVVAALASLSLLLVRRYPVASAVLPILTAGVLNRALPGLFSVYNLASTGRLGLAMVGGVVIALVSAARADSVIDWVGTTGSQLLVEAAALSLGLWLHGRRVLIQTLHDQVDVLRRERELRAEQARSAERSRIAREMHDVLAHRLSLLVLHAGVLRDQAQAGTVADDPARLAHRLELLRTTAARSLDDLRDVLGALRAEPRSPAGPGDTEYPKYAGDVHDTGGTGDAGDRTGDWVSAVVAVRPVPPRPSPSLSASPPVGPGEAGGSRPVRVPAPALRDLTELVGEAREAGQTVELALVGDPESIPTTHRLAVHRVVQEALTNARKYAHAAPVTVRVRYGAPATSVEVRNGPGEPAPSGACTGGGYGLVGLTERVGALGGYLDAGPDGHGGFRLAAQLPSPRRPPASVRKPAPPPYPQPMPYPQPTPYPHVTSHPQPPREPA
ncbi:sensor histidine kinase [Kitasatospora sp. NPDC087315]|uniref:sensor histidine kinase n=1 Tax=Kitasatospora sp. NPDC087315 TaxID=3364069 RepID=UPI00380BC78D